MMTTSNFRNFGALCSLYSACRSKERIIWPSKIIFKFNLRKINSENFEKLRELFGDGLLWAGCTFIALLGQQCRFEIFDHSYHLLKVNQTDGKTHTAHSISLEAFVNRIRRHQIMNNEIFSVINRYLRANEPEAMPNQNIQLFHPPAE